MIRLSDWEKPTVDVVPLFESVEDLLNAHNIMEQLYTNPMYANHLENREMKQTIMLGFSDGTKDMLLNGNWSIYQAKEALTTISRKYGVKVIFLMDVVDHRHVEVVKRISSTLL
jgi:phosphoenolpyruvate carboxylase